MLCGNLREVLINSGALWAQVNDAMLKEDRRWMSDRQRLNATFSLFIKRMEALVSFLFKRS